MFLSDKNVACTLFCFTFSGFFNILFYCSPAIWCLVILKTMNPMIVNKWGLKVWKSVLITQRMSENTDVFSRWAVVMGNKSYLRQQLVACKNRLYNKLEVSDTKIVFVQSADTVKGICFLVLELYSLDPHDLQKKRVCVIPPCPLMHILTFHVSVALSESLEKSCTLRKAVVVFRGKLSSPGFGLYNTDILKITDRQPSIKNEKPKNTRKHTEKT